MRQATREDYIEIVRDAVAFVLANLDDPLSLGEMARRAAFSAFHFHRLFQGVVGETPGEFVRRIRLERAAYRLSFTDRPIGDVAFEAGYGAPEAFTRAFREAYGESPSAFRRLGRSDYRQAAVCGVHYDPENRLARLVPRDTGGSIMEVELVEQPALRIAAVRHVGPYNQIGQAFETLGRLLGPTGLFAAPGAFGLALYRDDPSATPESELQSDAGLIVADDAPIPDGVEAVLIPGGRYAKYTYLGSYAGLGEAWGRLVGEWLPQSGYRFGPGTTYEIYRNSCQDVPVEELRTDLYLPLMKG